MCQYWEAQCKNCDYHTSSREFELTLGSWMYGLSKGETYSVLMIIVNCVWYKYNVILIGAILFHLRPILAPITINWIFPVLMVTHAYLWTNYRYFRLPVYIASSAYRHRSANFTLVWSLVVRMLNCLSQCIGRYWLSTWARILLNWGRVCTIYLSCSSPFRLLLRSLSYRTLGWGFFHQKRWSRWQITKLWRSWVFFHN